MFVTNQYLVLMLSSPQSLDHFAATLPLCAYHLLLWLMSLLTYSKVLNPMIFMTKEYFIEKVKD